jgi:alkylation response protein AidB-like acyl-CoA dehydrogenase
VESTEVTAVRQSTLWLEKVRTLVPIIDTWYTTGLRATGSNDFKVKDIFVRERLMIGLQAKKSAYQSGTLYQTTFLNISRWPMAVVGLGVAAEAIDSFAQLTATKVARHRTALRTLRTS